MPISAIPTTSQISAAICPSCLTDDLKDAKLKGYTVVAFTHLDEDHVKGSADFFELDHADKYKGGGRKKIETLWVPAGAITEESLKDNSRIIRQEARHRLSRDTASGCFPARNA